MRPHAATPSCTSDWGESQQGFVLKLPQYLLKILVNLERYKCGGTIYASRVTLQSLLHRSSPNFLLGSALVTHFCHMRSGWLAYCHQNEVFYHMFLHCVIICLLVLVLYIDTWSATKLFHSFLIWTWESQYLQKTVTYHKCALPHVLGLQKPPQLKWHLFYR